MPFVLAAEQEGIDVGGAERFTYGQQLVQRLGDFQLVRFKDLLVIENAFDVLAARQAVQRLVEADGHGLEQVGNLRVHIVPNAHLHQLFFQVDQLARFHQLDQRDARLIEYDIRQALRRDQRFYLADQVGQRYDFILQVKLRMERLVFFGKAADDAGKLAGRIQRSMGQQGNRARLDGFFRHGKDAAAAQHNRHHGKREDSPFHSKTSLYTTRGVTSSDGCF